MTIELSISNIAWEPHEDPMVAEVLQSRGVRKIDIAPGKYFPDLDRASSAEIEKVSGWWAGYGIRLHGMQALLFGTTGLNMFGLPDVQQSMLARLGAVCRVAGSLGIRPLTFGSPKNRDRAGLSDADAEGIAVDFFRRLGDLAARHDTSICLEPNPPRYACNFMTTTHEAARIVRLTNHPAIRLQLDSGALTICQENIDDVLEQHGAFIGHVHASEPDLVTLGTGETDHGAIAASLRRHLPAAVVAIEMRADDARGHVDAVAAAVDVALAHYVRPQA